MFTEAEYAGNPFVSYIKKVYQAKGENAFLEPGALIRVFTGIREPFEQLGIAAEAFLKDAHQIKGPLTETTFIAISDKLKKLEQDLYQSPGWAQFKEELSEDNYQLILKAYRFKAIGELFKAIEPADPEKAKLINQVYELVNYHCDVPDGFNQLINKLKDKLSRKVIVPEDANLKDLRRTMLFIRSLPEYYLLSPSERDPILKPLNDAVSIEKEKLKVGITQSKHYYYDHATHQKDTSWHAFKVEADKAQISNIKEELRTLKDEQLHTSGDQLKTHLLKGFLDQFLQCESQESLHKKKTELMKGDAYKILAQSQGLTTKMLSIFGKKTSSVDAFEKMYADILEKLPAAQSGFNRPID